MNRAIRWLTSSAVNTASLGITSPFFVLVFGVFLQQFRHSSNNSMPKKCNWWVCVWNVRSIHRYQWVFRIWRDFLLNQFLNSPDIYFHEHSLMLVIKTKIQFAKIRKPSSLLYCNPVLSCLQSDYTECFALRWKKCLKRNIQQKI